MNLKNIEKIYIYLMLALVLVIFYIGYTQTKIQSLKNDLIEIKQDDSLYYFDIERKLRKTNSKDIETLFNKVYEKEIEKAENFIFINYGYTDLSFKGVNDGDIVFYVWEIEEFMSVNLKTNTIIMGKSL